MLEIAPRWVPLRSGPQVKRRFVPPSHHCVLQLHNNSVRRRRLPHHASEPDRSGPIGEASMTSTMEKSEVVRNLNIFLKANEQDKAVKLAQSASEANVLRFGKGRMVPKQQFSLQELRLNKIQPEKLLSPKDNTLDGVRRTLQIGVLGAVAGSFVAFDLPPSSLFWLALAVSFLYVGDQVAFRGGASALLLDSAGRVLRPEYAQRVALHEAGHFLVAYLVGLLPSGYTLSAWDALVESRALNVQAGTRFCDLEFQREVALGKIRSGSVDTFTCVALAGVITEYLRFGSAEGGMGDVLQLDRLLRGIGFTQRKADDQVRWAVISTADMLRRHAGVQDALAEAMRSGMPVGDCIALIEERLAGCDDV